jgi:hypothetical protein
LKTLLTLLVIAALCSCSKHLEVVTPEEQLSISAFSSMLTKNNTYVVANYYTVDSTLAVPVVNSEDTYTFDGASNDGWISSKFPCIEYHYNFSVFASGDNIFFEWLDFSISPETFTVSDFQENEWFILKNGNTYTKYVRVITN